MTLTPGLKQFIARRSFSPALHFPSPGPARSVQSETQASVGAPLVFSEGKPRLEESMQIPLQQLSIEVGTGLQTAVEYAINSEANLLSATGGEGVDIRLLAARWRIDSEPI